MVADLIPTLAEYYQQSICTKEIGFKLQLNRHVRISQKLEKRLQQSQAEQRELCERIEELRNSNAKSEAILEVRQKEIESLRARHQDSDKADKAQAHSLKVQADSYKREIAELRDDLRLRDDDLRDLRQDAAERDSDLKEARNLTRVRDKEMKDVRDQLRARESEVRKANHMIEKLQAGVQRLELEVSEAHDASEALKDSLAEAEERFDTLQAQRQIATILPRERAPDLKKTKMTAPKQRIVQHVSSPAPTKAGSDVGFESYIEASEISQAPSPISQQPAVRRKPQGVATDPETDYTEPPSRPAKKVSISKPQTKQPASVTLSQTGKSTKQTSKSSVADKENRGPTRKATKKAKVDTEFSASPPRSSPPPESPKRKVAKKPDFSMTPFVDKTKKNVLSQIPLSPPSSKPGNKRLQTDSVVPTLEGDAKPKKKRKLLGGVRTLMDDTPKKVVSKAAKANFGKDLSPLKRPVSSSGVIIRD